ncbi:MAG: ComF family protein [Clostridia bacterium]|nr:ComF family protein [Clostridia bacterium]
MKVIELLLSLFFPEKCMFCGNITRKAENFICENCRQRVAFCKDLKCCSICGKPQVSLGEKEICYPCLTKTYRPYKRATAVVKYNDETKVGIKRYKNGNGEIVGEAMGVLMAERVKEVFGGVHFDFVTGIPPSDKRVIERGFDPVAVLCDSIAKELGARYEKRVIKKIKKTKKQSSLDYEHRIRNMIGAFGLYDGIDLKGKRILLVDDVMTTGATIEEGAYVLKKGGGKEIYAVTFATTTKEPKSFNEKSEKS